MRCVISLLPGVGTCDEKDKKRRIKLGYFLCFTSFFSIYNHLPISFAQFLVYVYDLFLSSPIFLFFFSSSLSSLLLLLPLLLLLLLLLFLFLLPLLLVLVLSFFFFLLLSSSFPFRILISLFFIPPIISIVIYSFISTFLPSFLPLF